MKIEVFTRRERQVLHLLARGNTNKEIAYQLNCAEGTVKSHIKNIMQKCGARNRGEVILIVAQFGIPTISMEWINRQPTV